MIAMDLPPIIEPPAIIWEAKKRRRSRDRRGRYTSPQQQRGATFPGVGWVALGTILILTDNDGNSEECVVTESTNGQVWCVPNGVQR